MIENYHGRLVDRKELITWCDMVTSEAFSYSENMHNKSSLVGYYGNFEVTLKISVCSIDGFYSGES